MLGKAIERLMDVCTNFIFVHPYCACAFTCHAMHEHAS